MNNKLTITINGVSFTAVEIEGEKLELAMTLDSSVEFTNLETGDKVELKLEKI